MADEVKEKEMVECPECRGTGSVDCDHCGSEEAQRCDTCGGKGTVEEEDED
jgi:DnaJ-class molecular chaperone